LGSTTICSGQQVGLQANTGSGLTYAWQRNGVIIPSATSSLYNATSGGAYTVTVTKGGCSATSGAVIVTVNTGSAIKTTIVRCGSYQWPSNGNTYTSSGIYYNTTDCKRDTLLLTIKPISRTITNATACSSYVWRGNTYTQTGSYTVTLTNSQGCDSLLILNLILRNSKSYTDTAVCVTSLPFSFAGNTYTASGVDTVHLTNVYGCDSTAVLNLTVSLAKPNTPTSLTQTLVSNNCGARIYRYSVGAMANAVGYSWTLPTSVGGVVGVTVDSGDINRSRVIRLRYLSNAAALTTDSIKVRAYSGCGNSAIKGFKLINTVLKVPVAPASIVVNAIQPNVCGNKIYRFTAPALSVGSSTVAPATGYSWTFTGSLGANAVIDSGDIRSRVIRVSFTSNAPAATGDSVRVFFTSDCGSSLNRAIKLPNLATKVPTAPSSIIITPIKTNICSNRTYRYTAPKLPVGSSTTAAATGYFWSFSGELGVNAFIDSGSIYSKVIRVRYSSNAASVPGDSVRLCYTSSCGNSLNRSLKLSNTLLNPPSAPASIVVTPLQTNVCGLRIYRYSAPELPAASTSTVAATGYLWSFTGTLGANASIDSGSLNSREIRVVFSSNSASTAGDSIRVLYLSDCGIGKNKSLKLTNVLLSPPSAPSYITIAPVQVNTCGARIYRYTAPALPAATAANGAPTGYLWSFVGTLGANAVIDSGSIYSRIILVKYSSNVAAGAGDSVRVLYTSACGNSATKSMKLSNTELTAPAAPQYITITPVSPNTCGNRVYRYTAPLLTSATTSSGAANGYLWSFAGTLGINAVLDSGSINSRTILVHYTSNAASAPGDSVRIQYISTCGNSAKTSIKLSNSILICTPPYAKNQSEKPITVYGNAKVYAIRKF